MPRPFESEPGRRVLGVLAGRDMPLGLLKRWADSADVVLAADAGLDRLLGAGAKADAVVGDLDSVQGLSSFEGAVHRDEDEEATDCDKLLALAHSQGFERITLASVEGDQLDHMLATLHSALRSPLRVKVALRTGVGWVLNARDGVSVPTQAGRRVSLLPLEECSGVDLGGVRWPLDGAPLHPLGATSISNRAVGSVVSCSIEKGSGLLFVGFLEEEMPVW